MNRILELMAELTAARDREMLDRTLALALGTMLQADGVTLAGLIGEGQQQRWLTRARHQQGACEAVGELSFNDASDLPEPDTQPGWLECVRTQQPVLCADTPAVSLWPLPTDTATSDVLELRTAAPLSSEERYRLGGLLRIYRNMSALLDGCERDALTGLLNRTSFDKTFLQATVIPASERNWIGAGTEHRRSARAMPQWLGVLDLDHFKLVNDVHGHVIGDEVLMLVARIMRATFRSCDRLYRFGGEEFVVLLTAPDEASAGSAFERLRAQLELAAFPRVGRVTASIGFTAVRRGDMPQAAFERADRAVYHGKKSGRNQVHGFEALVALGLLREGSQVGSVELF